MQVLRCGLGCRQFVWEVDPGNWREGMVLDAVSRWPPLWTTGGQTGGGPWKAPQRRHSEGQRVGVFRLSSTHWE